MPQPIAKTYKITPLYTYLPPTFNDRLAADHLKRAAMFIRAYLRASTTEQDATRAAEQLKTFCADHGHKIAATYTENASGATADRPELRRLLNDCQAGDVLLVESVDRLTRLPRAAWELLRAEIRSRGVCIVAADLPTTHQAMTGADDWMLSSINEMLLDMAAAMARTDYDLKRERQRQGIEKAKAKGLYHGRPRDEVKRKRIADLLIDAKWSIRKIATTVGCSTSTVHSVKLELRERGRNASGINSDVESKCRNEKSPD